MIKKIIAFTVFFIALMICFKSWLNTQFVIAENCAHIDRVSAWKTGELTLNGKNELGEDSSCYVIYELNGKRERKSEYWNVGNCDDKTMIEIDVIDYSCH